jgi:spore coat protein B
MSRSGTYESSTDSNFYHGFMESLIGKTVTVYRGGPESKTGRLIAVQPDYIVLLPENQQQDTPVIYYYLQHVPSISENVKTNSIQQSSVTNNEEKIKFVQSHSFQGLLKGLINSNIKVNQGGPEAKLGKLLNVIDNYIFLFTEDDGVVFYNINHIKSVTSQATNEAKEVVVSEQATNEAREVVVSEQATNEAREVVVDEQATNEAREVVVGEQATNEAREVIVSEQESYINIEDFQDLFSYLTNKWVSINRGGPEAVEGVLVQGIDGHYMLVNNAEVIRVNPYHIKSISCGPRGFLKATKQNNVNNAENTEQQSNNTANDKSKSKIDEKEAGKKEEKKDVKKDEKKDEKKKDKKK